MSFPRVKGRDRENKGLIGMGRLKTGLIKVFFLFIFPGWVCSTHCFSETDVFLEAEEPHGVRHLRRDIKIPVGVADNTLHHAQLRKGTPLHEISSKISQRREEIGLSPEISLEQQDEFFQDFSWQIPKQSVVKSFIPGRIVEVFVHKGQHVEKGDRLCEIECMKMYLTIRSPFPGETTDIFLKEKDNVQYDAPLIGLLPTSPEWEEVDREHILDHKDFLLSCFPWAMSPPLERLLTQDDLLPNGGEEKENQNGFLADPNLQPIEPLEEKPPSSPVLPLEETQSEQCISDLPKEIVLEEIESSSLSTVLQIVLPTEEVIIPLQVSREDSLQEEILVKPLLQPIQVLEETVAPVLIPFIEEKALESQDPIVLPVKGIVVPLHMDSEDDVYEEKILMKPLPQPIEALDETPAPIPQSFAEEIECKEPTIRDQQDSIVSMDMTDNTPGEVHAQENSIEQLILEAPKELIMEKTALFSLPQEVLSIEKGVVPPHMDLEEPIQQEQILTPKPLSVLDELSSSIPLPLAEEIVFEPQSSVALSVKEAIASSHLDLESLDPSLVDNISPSIPLPFIEEVLPDLQQESETLEEEVDTQGTKESVSEKETRSLCPLSLKIPYSLPTSVTPAETVELDSRFRGKDMRRKQEKIFSLPMNINAFISLVFPRSHSNFNTPQKTLVSSAKVSLRTPEEKKSFFDHSHKLLKTQPAYCESDLSILSETAGMGVLLLLCSFLFRLNYYRLRYSRPKKIYYNNYFIINIRYLHAVNINQQRFIIHQAAYDMNLYVDLKRKPLNQNDDQRKGIINWRIS
jgi:biotin carboxyl carrier protein